MTYLSIPVNQRPGATVAVTSPACGHPSVAPEPGAR